MPWEAWNDDFFVGMRVGMRLGGVAQYAALHTALRLLGLPILRKAFAAMVLLQNQRLPDLRKAVRGSLTLREAFWWLLELKKAFHGSLT